MPSPIGHALGGLTVGLLASSRPGWKLLTVCAVAAALPDADFLLPMRHRGPSHSIGAAVIIAGVTTAVWALVGSRRDRLRSAGATGIVIGIAYATHVLFDWLGADSSTPRGLMALWPVSSQFFISDLDVFNSVDRRYWLDGFLRRSLESLARELLILGPVLAAAWAWGRRRRPRLHPD